MIYTFLADGFEEVEALCPVDIMRRAGLEVTTIGVGKREITGSHGITVLADIADSGLCLKDVELIFLPGGMPGTKNLDASATVHNAINTALEQGAYIAAICAAPMILGKRGLLNGKKAVCYPGFEQYLEGAILSSNEKIAVDGRIITAKGMGVASELGFELVKILCGSEKSKALRKATISE